MHRWRGKAAAITAVLAAAVTACGTGNTGGGDTRSASTKLTVGLSMSPQSLAANVPVTGGQTLYYTPVYDSLLYPRPDGTQGPMLAEKWSYDTAQTTLTLTLRTGVKFTDGEAFDANAAKANLERNKAGGNGQALRAVKSVSVQDQKTLVLTLAQKDPAVLGALATSAGYMQAPGTFDKPDAATKPVGTGPYTVDPSTVVGSSYVYKKNPSYWNASAVHYDEIDLKAFPDPSGLLNAIKTGQVNAAQIGNSVGDQIKQSGWSVAAQELDVAGLFLFDRAGKLTPALADKRVRQAINLAIDRDAVLRAIAAGKGTPTAQLFTGDAGSLAPELDAAWAYNPAKAKELLKAAGHESDVKVVVPAFAQAKPLMEVIKQQLGAIGITVELKDAGPNAISDMLAGKYSMSYFQLASADPWLVMRDLLLPQSPFNPFHFEDPKVTELVAQYRDGDDAAKQSTLKQLNAYLTDQAWVAPWYRVQTPWAVDARTTVQLLKGWNAPYVLSFAPKG